MTGLPTRPGDIAPGTGPTTLAYRLDTSARALDIAASTDADPLPPARRVEHAVAMGAAATVLAWVAHERRYEAAVAALTEGATIEQVAAAVGWEPGEVAAHVTGWADHRRRARRITTTDYEEIVALVSTAPREGGAQPGAPGPGTP